MLLHRTNVHERKNFGDSGHRMARQFGFSRMGTILFGRSKNTQDRERRGLENVIWFTCYIRDVKLQKAQKAIDAIVVEDECNLT
jgi:hypothetical protein